MTQSVRDSGAGIHGSSSRVLTENSAPQDLLIKAQVSRRSSHRQDSELLSEDVFKRILSWERKRTERSGKCLLLMLADVESALGKHPTKKDLLAIASALSSPTRETDIFGWHQNGSVLGIIFVELQKRDRDALQPVMSSEVIARLRENLGPEKADQIRISFHFFPEEWDKPNGSGLIDENLYPDLEQQNLGAKVSRMAKRGIDIAGSLFAIILFSPLFILISLAVRLTSKGPILFRQERVGQFGRRFSFLKFRSMQCVNDSQIHQDYVRRFISGEIAQTQGATYKIQKDPRLTSIGGFLRKCSLDELPQLINVLKGDMSLVGPRPAIPYEINFYQVWHRTRFLEVKPGITGLWQVMGRSKTTFDDMVRLDLRYVKQWSLWRDIKILLQTPAAVISGKGAY